MTQRICMRSGVGSALRLTQPTSLRRAHAPSCGPQASRQDLEPAGVRLLPRERADAEAPAVAPACPAKRCRDVDEPDAAARRLARAAERMIKRRVAQIAAGIARDEGRNA